MTIFQPFIDNTIIIAIILAKGEKISLISKLKIYRQK